MSGSTFEKGISLPRGESGNGPSGSSRGIPECQTARGSRQQSDRMLEPIQGALDPDDQLRLDWQGLG